MSIAIRTGSNGAGPWTRARAAWRRAGVRGLWFGACADLAYRRLLLLERPLDAPPPVLEVPPLEIVRLDDEPDYRSFRPETPDGEFRARRAAGGVCFAALVEGRVVGATWARVGGGPAPYLGRELRFTDGDVYLFDTLIVPELRGRRIAPAIALAQIAFYRAAGFRRLVCTVLPENATSLRARRRTGFVVYGVAGSVALGPLCFPFERHFADRREPFR